MPFLDREHDGMQVVQAFGRLCNLLSSPYPRSVQISGFIRHSEQELRSHRRNNGQVPPTDSASTSCAVGATQTQAYQFSAQDVPNVCVACAGQE